MGGTYFPLPTTFHETIPSIIAITSLSISLIALNGSDFNAWNSHKFASNTNWCEGNFNADTVVDGSDFSLWNANKFTMADGAATDGQSVGHSHASPGWLWDILEKV